MIVKQVGLAVLQGVGIVVAQAISQQAEQQGRSLAEIASEVLIDDLLMDFAAELADSPTPPTVLTPPGSAFGLGMPPAPVSGPRTPRSRVERRADAKRDRTVSRKFRTWLHQQAELRAPSVEEEARMLEAAFSIARAVHLDPHDPIHVAEWLDELLDIETDDLDVVSPLLITVHDYTHSQLVLDPGSAEWSSAHDVAASADLDETDDPLTQMIAEAASIDPDERRNALARTRLITAPTELLEWIGVGQAVTQTGVLGRADIKSVGAMFGLDDEGVAKLPPSSETSLPTSPVDLSTAFPMGTRHVQSINDILERGALVACRSGRRTRRSAWHPRGPGSGCLGVVV